MGVALRVNRFLQDPGCCGIAAAATVANYFNKDIDYDYATTIVKPTGEGLYTPEIAVLLNRLGFRSVTIVSADINHLDFEWQGMTKPELVRQLRRVAKNHSDRSIRNLTNVYVDFLRDTHYDNHLIIDHHFGKYIRRYLKNGPMLLSFNWNLFFGYPKMTDDGHIDAIRGDMEQHEVVLYGYDEQGVQICDSHHEFYKDRLAKFSNGRYRMDWETLHTVMGFGDLIIPEHYSHPDVENYELV